MDFRTQSERQIEKGKSKLNPAYMPDTILQIEEISPKESFWEETWTFTHSIQPKY